ncbi:hypothetical protein PAHAL_5G349000 [Panicum hallii]|nr:hypothetical protein PAHAL_5G349000 [Panicum hallii]
MEEGTTESGSFSRSSSFGGFEEWVALVRKRNERTSCGRLAIRSSASSEVLELADPDSNVIEPDPCDQVPEASLWERLGRVSMMDIESSNFSWSSLTSLHHTKHTATSIDTSEDDINRSFEGRVIHNSSSEWQQIKDAVENARHVSIAAGDELEEMICAEMLEALELSRCLFLMNYVHGSPLLENTVPYDSREAAEKTAEALGRVLILDLVLRNEDRLRCRALGWRGNYANLLIANKEAYANLDSLDDVYDSAIIRYKPEIIRSPQKQKQRRTVSISGSIGSDVSDLILEDSYVRSEPEFSSFNIVAIDSGVPRRPPAGKRAKDQESYPKLVELTLNNFDYSSKLLFEVSFGKLGVPGSEGFDVSSDYSYNCPLSESDTVAIVHSFRGGFRSALRDLQRFHIFLITLYQKLDGLLKIFFNIMYKCSNEYDKEDAGTSDSPLCSVEAQADSNDTDVPRNLRKPSRTLSRDSLDLSSPCCRESFMTKHFKGNGDASRGLRLTMKLRDFNK